MNTVTVCGTSMDAHYPTGTVLTWVVASGRMVPGQVYIFEFFNFETGVPERMIAVYRHDAAGAGFLCFESHGDAVSPRIPYPGADIEIVGRVTHAFKLPAGVTLDALCMVQ